MTAKTFGIHEDSDGALVDSREEYGSSTSSSSDAYENSVDFDGVSKAMNSYEE